MRWQVLPRHSPAHSALGFTAPRVEVSIVARQIIPSLAAMASTSANGMAEMSHSQIISVIIDLLIRNFLPLLSTFSNISLFRSRVNSFLASYQKKRYYIDMDHSEFAKMGGLARAKKLSAKRRKQIARQAGLAGGRGRKKPLRAAKKKA